jgi:hypothetical protein
VTTQLVVAYVVDISQHRLHLHIFLQFLPLLRRSFQGIRFLTHMKIGTVKYKVTYPASPTAQ